MRPLIALALATLTIASVAPAIPTEARTQSRAALPMGPGAQLINLPRGSSMAIDLPSDARDVITDKSAQKLSLRNDPEWMHSPCALAALGSNQFAELAEEDSGDDDDAADDCRGEGGVVRGARACARRDCPMSPLPPAHRPSAR